MSVQPAGTDRHGLNWRLISLLLVAAGLVLLLVANAHLVYVALESQPDCLPHAKQADGSMAYRAARSAC